MKKNVLDALADGDGFDVPPSLFEQEYESVARAMNPNAAQKRNNHESQDDDHDHAAADEGMSKAGNAQDLEVAYRYASTYGAGVIAEQFVSGPEYTVAILGESTAEHSH